MNGTRISLILLAGVFLVSCSNTKVTKTQSQGTVKERRRDRDGKIFGDDVTLWTSDRKRDVQAGAGTGIGVNAHLWHGALETASFLPIASADPFGGVIITDWYTSEKSPNERIKLNIFILDRLLRSDAIKVTVFNEKWNEAKKQWVAVSSDRKVAMDLENVILTKARRLRISNPNGS
jgi:hypothetical protein